MKGTMLIISPGGGIQTVPLPAPPTLERLQEAVDGYATQVPYLDSVEHAGTVYQCVAYVDEEGLLKKKPVNEPANRIWDAALKRNKHEDVRYQVGRMARMFDAMEKGEPPPIGSKDTLVGNLVVIYGDAALMRSL